MLIIFVPSHSIVSDLHGLRWIPGIRDSETEICKRFIEEISQEQDLLENEESRIIGQSEKECEADGIEVSHRPTGEP